MEPSSMLAISFIAASVFLAIVTFVYNLRDRRHKATLREITALNDTLEEESRRQNETIALLQKDCREKYREQFTDIKSCLEQAIVLKDQDSARQRYVQRLEQQLSFFSSSERQAEREAFINQRTGGVFDSLRYNFPSLKETDFQLLTFIIMGFDATLICMITGMTASNYYTRKSRLKEKLLNEDSPDAPLYRQWIF